MKAAPVSSPNYEARIRRAELLATRYPFAAEVLNFYRGIAGFQRNLYSKLPVRWGNQPLVHPGGRLRSELNLVVLLPHVPAWLDLIAGSAPAPVAQAARRFAALGSNGWIARFADFWSLGAVTPHSTGAAEAQPDPLEEFLLLGFLQPYCEFIALHQPEPPSALTTQRECPRCGSGPFLGVLRQEGDGGKRRLLCSFCLQEWDFRRIYCAACGEEDEKKLPVYVAEQFPHVRVECCDTCNTCLRTIDLTKDGHAIPIVDDLAALPLTLWAQERHYARIHPNLLST